MQFTVRMRNYSLWAKLIVVVVLRAMARASIGATGRARARQKRLCGSPLSGDSRE